MTARKARVLEVGASRGCSSIWIAAGLKAGGGQLVSIEVDPVKVEVWRRNIAAARLEDVARGLEFTVVDGAGPPRSSNQLKSQP